MRLPLSSILDLFRLMLTAKQTIEQEKTRTARRFIEKICRGVHISFMGDASSTPHLQNGKRPIQLGRGPLHSRQMLISHVPCVLYNNTTSPFPPLYKVTDLSPICTYTRLVSYPHAVTEERNNFSDRSLSHEEHLPMSPATFRATSFLASDETGESPMYMSKKAPAHQNTRLKITNL